MLASITTVWVTALLLAWAPSPSAQDAAAPAPGPDQNVLYIHSDDAASGWMNPLPEDGASATLCHTTPMDSEAGGLCPNAGGSFTITVPLAPATDVPLALDPAGSVDLAIYFGGNCCTVGTASLTVTLAAGETTIATASGDHLMNPAAANDGLYNLFSASVAPEVEQVASAAGLMLTVAGSGTWSHAAISTSPDRGQSTVTLPIVAGAPAAEDNETEGSGNETGDDGGAENGTGNSTGADGNGTSPMNDADGDGLDDAWETEHFGDTDATNGSADPDDDGLANVDEQAAGTDPNEADTDSDGLADGEEVHTHLTDPLAPDTDGDGFGDGQEVAAGTDPLDAASTPDADPEFQEGGGDGDTTSPLDDGYLVTSGLLLAALVVVVIVALAGRWKK